MLTQERVPAHDLPESCPRRRPCRIGFGVGFTILVATALVSPRPVHAQSPLIIQPSTGQVGIGTSYPQSKLHIQANNAATDIILDSRSAGGGDSALRLIRNGIGTEELRLIAAAGGASGQNNLYLLDLIGVDGPTTRDFQIRSSTNGGSTYTDLMRITRTGNVGLGTTAPASRLDVTGGCITGSLCSDRRLKANIAPLSADGSYLEKVLQLRGVSFEWKGRGDGQRHIGLMAQEVEQVLPEVVTTPTPDNGQKGLSCTGLDAVLIEAIKEQQAQIRILRDEVALLKSRLSRSHHADGRALPWSRE